MAYLSSEEVTARRNEIKKAFPAKKGYKFSITRHHYSGIDIAIMSAPIDFGTDHKQVNEYYIAEHYEGKQRDFLLKINEIAGKGSYNRNAGDLGADYGDMTFFVSVSIGKWNKAFIQS